MSSQLAVRLLKPNTDRIAKAVARQIRRTVPRYEQVEPVALERNIRTVMNGVIRLLERGDQATLLRTIEDIAQLRSATGFQVSEFLVAAVSFLPVVRRFVIGSAPSVQEGLAAYEAIEGIALPLFGQGVELFLECEAGDEITSPGLRRLSTEGLSLPLRIESVEEEVEATPPFGRR